MSNVAQIDDLVKKHYYTVTEARKILRLSIAAFYRNLRNGKIPYRRVNRNYLIPSDFLFPEMKKSSQAK